MEMLNMNEMDQIIGGFVSPVRPKLSQLRREQWESEEKARLEKGTSGSR